MSAFVGLGRPRANFSPTAVPRATGFAAGLSPRAEAMPLPPTPAPALSVEDRPAVPVAPAAAEISAAEQVFVAQEQLRAREHQMMLAELEAERKRLRDASSRLGHLAGEVTRLRGQLLAELRAQAGDVLLAGAQALATRAVQADPAILLAMVDEAVATLGGEGVTVRVNPVDVERVAAAFGDGATVIGDASVAGGCICEGPRGSVDRRLDTAVAALASETSAWKKTS